MASSNPMEILNVLARSERKIAPVLVLALLVLSAVSAAAHELVVMPSVDSYVVLTSNGSHLAPTTIDFGDSPCGESAEATISVSNKSRRAIVITSTVDPSGASPTVSPPQVSLAPAGQPGDSGTLQIVVTPSVTGLLSGEIALVTSHDGVPTAGADKLSYSVLSGTPVAEPRDIYAYLSDFSVSDGGTIDIHAATTESQFDLAVYRVTGAGEILETTVEDIASGPHTLPEEAWLGAGLPVRYSLPMSWGGGLFRIQLSTSTATADLEVVVREAVPGSHSDVLVLDSSPTWVAYNSWGGKSTYAFNSKCGEADEVALGRPGQNEFSDETEEFYLWTQAKGISVEYASLFDLHYESSLLADYNLVVIVGHSEYWSRPMRAHFDSFVAAGGNALILSGNTMWWQIRLENDRLVCYKNPAELDPEYSSNPSLVTTNWYLPPVNDAENKSIGVSFRSGGFVNSGGHYPASEGYGGFVVAKEGHWLFEGTGLMNNDILGQAVTIVGYETDGAELACDSGQPLYSPEIGVPGAEQVCPNSFPIVTGSDDTPLHFEVLGYSKAAANSGLGVATMGIMEGPAPKGSIFNAATVDWVDGLWSLQKSEVPDFRVSQITSNAIRALSNQDHPLTFDTEALAIAKVGEPYSAQVAVSTGVAPYTWALAAGQLPGGLSLDSANGVISGTPLSAGTSVFSVTVTDNESRVVTASFQIEVDPAS